MERLDFDLLFRWFVGLGIDDPVWDHSTFSKNRDRLLDGDVAARVPGRRCSNRPKVRRLLSSRALQRRRHADREPGPRRRAFDPARPPTTSRRMATASSRAIPKSTSTARSERMRHTPADTDLRNAALSQVAWAGSEARAHGPCADREPTRPGGAAPQLTQADRSGRTAGRPRHGRRSSPGRHRITVGGRHGPTTSRASSPGCGRLSATPHVAQHRYVTKTGRHRRASIDRRTARHPGYLRRASARRKLDRGGVRLDQDHRRPAQDQVPGRRSRRMGLHAGGGRLQPDPPAQAPARLRHHEHAASLRDRSAPASQPRSSLSAAKMLIPPRQEGSSTQFFNLLPV